MLDLVESFVFINLGFVPFQLENYGKQIFKLIDKNGDGTIDFREFLVNVSIETRGTLDEKLEHVFNLYDLDKNGYVTKSEMIEFIKVRSVSVNTPV